MYHRILLILLKKQIIDQKNRNKQMQYQVETVMANGNILIIQMLLYQIITIITEMEAEIQIMVGAEIMEETTIIHLILIIVLYQHLPLKLLLTNKKKNNNQQNQQFLINPLFLIQLIQIMMIFILQRINYLLYYKLKDYLK